MPYKIAITSSNGSDIDLHFGHATGFYIIEVDEKKEIWSLQEFREIPDDSESDGTTSKELGCNGHDENRLLKIAQLLEDCPYLLTGKIGIKPYRVLKRNGVSSLEIQGTFSDIINKFHDYYSKQNLSKEVH